MFTIGGKRVKPHARHFELLFIHGIEQVSMRMFTIYIYEGKIYIVYGQKIAPKKQNLVYEGAERNT